GRVHATAIELDSTLDAAVMHVKGPWTADSVASDATNGLEWTVLAQPSPGDPQLTGLVSSVHRPVQTEQGHELPMMQLHVTQDLRDFRGYSGSAVRLASSPRTIVGLLSEQVLERMRSSLGGRPAATNVLYAVPIGLIIERFQLAMDEVPVRSPYSDIAGL